jgi:MFS family permease
LGALAGESRRTATDSSSWVADNAFPIVTSLILTPVAYELKPKYPPLLTLAQNIGLLVGAAVFSTSSDIYGRKLAFNITLGIAGLWALIGASAPTVRFVVTLDAALRAV